MLCRYYRGERKNPFERPDGERSDDVRALYWWREQFVSGIRNPTEGIKVYPCNIWPDFIQRAKVNLSERGLAFEIDYQNSKHNCGEYNEDWHSYFAGPRVSWQETAFDMPEVKIDQDRYVFADCEDIYGYNSGKLIDFGPIVSAIYRGIAETRYGQKTPVFEIENLRGDKLYLNTPGFLFRTGKLTVAGQFRRGEDDLIDVYVYDKRLHVALAKLVLDEETPVICVGERLSLPSLAEAEKDLKWYRLAR